MTLSRRHLVILLLSFFVLGCSESERPNVVLITMDTTRADHLSCYGYSRPTSPVLDGVATRGAIFDKAYCTIPSTLPSHASILTGLHPLRLGVHDNNTKIPDEARTMAEILSEKGYETTAFLSSFVLGQPTNISQGFAHFDCQEDFGSDAVDEAVNVIPGSRSAEATAEKALGWVREQRSPKRPFFIWVHFYDPHFPYNPPESFDRFLSPGVPEEFGLYKSIESGKYSIGEVFASATEILSVTEYQRAIDLYDGEIFRMDDAIGSILDSVNSLNELGRETVFVAVADHGESFGEHGLSFCHELLDEPCMRVPLIMSYPGRILEGKRVEFPVSTVDILPTVLSLLDIEVKDNGTMQGKNLLPYLTGERPGQEVAFGEDGRGLYMIRTDSRKAVISEDKKDIRVYDLAEDPSENINAADYSPGITRELVKQIERWFVQSMDYHLGDTEPISNVERMKNLEGLGYLRGKKRSQ